MVELLIRREAAAKVYQLTCQMVTDPHPSPRHLELETHRIGGLFIRDMEKQGYRHLGANLARTRAGWHFDDGRLELSRPRPYVPPIVLPNLSGVKRDTSIVPMVIRPDEAEKWEWFLRGLFAHDEIRVETDPALELEAQDVHVRPALEDY